MHILINNICTLISWVHKNDYKCIMEHIKDSTECLAISDGYVFEESHLYCFCNQFFSAMAILTSDYRKLKFVHFLVLQSPKQTGHGGERSVSNINYHHNFIISFVWKIVRVHRQFWHFISFKSFPYNCSM